MGMGAVPCDGDDVTMAGMDLWTWCNGVEVSVVPGQHEVDVNVAPSGDIGLCMRCYLREALKRIKIEK